MKNKAKLINVKIPEYWVEVADDYHEFKNIEYLLNKIVTVVITLFFGLERNQ